ncbi:hypothetical protein JW758_04715 [Candidatus Peregrinibacteria bacterium]|nr:hypothetical protein [Candidatus Peregrinibacteria bacterium]
MDYLIVLLKILTPFILGLLAYRFLPSYVEQKGKNLATKEDIGKITDEIESVKNLYKQHYDLSKTERAFYDEMIKAIYNFVAEIKKYEYENGKDSATKEVMKGDEDLRNKFFEFVNAANEILAKAFVFLKEENYMLLKEALKVDNSFAAMTRNLLYAMRKSIHPNTKLSAETDTREISY